MDKASLTTLENSMYESRITCDGQEKKPSKHIQHFEVGYPN